MYHIPVEVNCGLAPIHRQLVMMVGGVDEFDMRELHRGRVNQPHIGQKGF